MTVRLTKEDFIRRSMRGEVFAYETNKFHYDKTKYNPFRMDDNEMGDIWRMVNGYTEFILLPKKERRYRYKTEDVGITQITPSYMSDEYADKWKYSQKGFIKLEEDYIDVDL